MIIKVSCNLYASEGEILFVEGIHSFQEGKVP
jgi:hypothetical protein